MFGRKHVETTIVETAERAILPAGRPSRARADEAVVDAFVERNLLRGDDIRRVREVALSHRIPIATAAAQLGLIDERTAIAVLSDVTKIAPADMARMAPLPERLRGIKPEFFFDARVIPIGEEDGAILLAISDPFDDFPARSLEQVTGLDVRPRLASANEIESALMRTFRAGDASLSLGSSDSTDQLNDLASAAPAVRYLDQLLSEAVDLGATDIHIEPHSRGARVRMRKDGDLRIVTPPSASLTAAVISRIKIISGLDVAERRLPQDGRMKLAISGKPVDFRISTIPMLNGESVVMRVLDQSASALDLNELGFPQTFRTRFAALLNRPHGVILVTGPTGSGKTTTLYSALSMLKADRAKIITVEDPVEYQIDGVAQLQVDAKTGLTFARGLRSVLRHDPDVIMIGEIRDLETATIAVQAALTGHLVLATLHANSAASAVTRLRDIGIQNFMLTSVITGVVAQRLIRKLCTRCKAPRTLPTAIPGLPEVTFRAVGCEACGGGYAGRIAIAELLAPDEEVISLVLRDANHQAIEAAACAAGMTRLPQEALALVADGATSIEEATRVAPAPDLASVSP